MSGCCVGLEPVAMGMVRCFADGGVCELGGGNWRPGGMEGEGGHATCGTKAGWRRAVSDSGVRGCDWVVVVWSLAGVGLDAEPRPCLWGNTYGTQGNSEDASCGGRFDKHHKGNERSVDGKSEWYDYSIEGRL